MDPIANENESLDEFIIGQIEKSIEEAQEIIHGAGKPIGSIEIIMSGAKLTIQVDLNEAGEAYEESLRS